MNRTKIIATVVGALVAMAGGAALWYGAPQEASADHALDDGCTDETGGTTQITIGGIAAQFVPSCVIVDEQTKITWENNDAFGHDPGDGTEADQTDDCFSATKDIGGFLPSGDTYSVQLRFDEADEKLYREKAWFNGDDITDTLSDPAADEACPDHVWEWHDDAHTQIAIDYICHRHPSTMHGKIIMNVG